MKKIDNFKLEHFDIINPTKDGRNEISVYQSDNYYKFTQDAIMLAKFCNIKHSDDVLELCAGSGVISFYAYSLCPYNHLYFNEIQPEMCEIIEENIAFNGFKRRSKIFNCNLKDLKLSDFKKSLDVVICNPPYFKINGKIKNDPKIAMCRHEISVTLSQIVQKSSQLIKDKGKFYIVIPAERMCEIIKLFGEFRFEVKRMEMYEHGGVATVCVFEAVKNANSGVKIKILKESL